MHYLQQERQKEKQKSGWKRISNEKIMPNAAPKLLLKTLPEYMVQPVDS